jgi:hypothetical protein
MNKVNRLVPQASPTEPRLVNDDRDRTLGKMRHETSHMVSRRRARWTFMYGDIAEAYRVVDRIALFVVSVAAVGAAGRRPTGQSWIVARSRGGGRVVIDNAARLNKVR